MIVVHIGLRKAGSSTLQRFLAANAALLEKNGYHYPNIGFLGRSSHFNLANELRGRPQFRLDGGTIADVTRYWREARGSAMILSSEIFENAKPGEIRRLRDDLRTADTDIRIVAVIRDLGNLVQSSYAEQIKGARKLLNFDETFVRWIELRRADYFATINRWAEEFGWADVVVRILDRDLLLNGDLADDFMDAAGVELTPQVRNQLKRPGPANVSPGWRVVEAMRALYGEFHGLPETHPLVEHPAIDEKSRRKLLAHAEEISQGLGWNSDRSLYLTREQAEQCLDIYSESVRRLNEHLNRSLPLPASLEERGFVEREFLPDASKIPSAELRAFYDALGEAASGDPR